MSAPKIPNCDVRTVGELRAALAAYPDDMLVSTSDSMDHQSGARLAATACYPAPRGDGPHIYTDGRGWRVQMVCTFSEVPDDEDDE